MSRISDAILDSLLEEINDYQSLELSEEEYSELQVICDEWEDKDSIETEINIYIAKLGYEFDDDEFMWIKD